MIEIWSWIKTYLIVASLSWTTNKLMFLKGSVLFLVKVKLKSYAILPFLNLMPPSIHVAGIVEFS